MLLLLFLGLAVVTVHDGDVVTCLVLWCLTGDVVVSVDVGVVVGCLLPWFSPGLALWALLWFCLFAEVVAGGYNL